MFRAHDECVDPLRENTSDNIAEQCNLSLRVSQIKTLTAVMYLLFTDKDVSWL